MGKLYALKQGEKEIFFQIEFSKKFWDFLLKLEKLVLDSSIISLNFEQEEYKENLHFSENKNGVYFTLIFANDRVNISIFGHPEVNKIKELLIKNYDFQDD